jgi:hypothetical protein
MAGLTVAQRAEKEARLKAEKEALLNDQNDHPDLDTSDEQEEKLPPLGIEGVKVNAMLDELVENPEVSKQVLDLRKALDMYKIAYSEEDTHDLLLNKLTAHISNQNAVIGSRVDNEEAELRAYMNNTNLTNVEFVKRLKALGIQKRYISKQFNKATHQDWYLFDDKDHDISDAQIHSRVRFSDINPVKEEDLYKVDTLKIMRERGR